MPITELQNYRSRAARAALLVHERELPEFVRVWRQAKECDVQLPESGSPNYRSLEALLRHGLRVPSFNMVWICEQLGLPEPQIAEPPPVEEIADKADDYLKYLLPALRRPLADVAPERFTDRVYASRWNQEYTVDSMLEHLIAHAMKHRFQLEELIEKQP